ncbi:MAG: TetR/AcrR family transcriptional regulator [Candidatus Krumholzibacteriia bacterium]
MARTSPGDKKQRILDAAVVEIARRGYHQTTVAMIARRAGVADGTIYLYFKNKDEVLVSLFDRALGRFIEEGRDRLAGFAGAEAKLRDIVERHLTLVGQDRDLAIITQVELRHSLHFMEELSRAQVGRYLEIIAEVLAEGRVEGVFRAGLDPVLGAKAVFGILDEMATDWVLSRRNTRLEGKAREVADLILGGVARCPRTGD